MDSENLHTNSLSTGYPSLDSPRVLNKHQILRLDEAKTGKAIKKLPTLKRLDGAHV